MIETQKIDENRYVVYENGIGVPGVYESLEVAKKAPQMTDEEIIEILGPIYQVDGEDRAVTDNDMFHALEAMHERRLNNYRGTFADEMADAGE